MSEENPEVGQFVTTGAIRTNYHDVGPGDGASIGDATPVLLLHGSGPGVSAYANWRPVLAQLQDRFRLIAPDFAGFGYTESPAGQAFTQEVWLRQLVDFLDAIGVDKVSVVGNSFGGSMALALAIHYPERVDRLILMGAVGVPFEITDGLDRVWGYQPSPENMRSIMTEVFAYDPTLITDQLVALRYAASVRPGVQEAFASIFPAPRQRWVDAMAHAEAAVRAITAPTLLVHGRDDKVIPLQTTLTLLDWIEDSQAHIFGRCGHWTQIEHTDEFCAQVADFLNRA